MLAFGAWVLGLALAVFFFKAGVACAGGAADGGVGRAVIRLWYKVFLTNERGGGGVLAVIVIGRDLVSLLETAGATAPGLFTARTSAIPNALACVDHG
jgi:hypothetical protein